MIKITIVGGRNEVEKVRVVLKDRYGEMYSCRVIENIPEAVQNGAKFCTASFLVDDRYIDLDQFNKIKCKFSIVFNNKKMYERSKGCKTGKWLPPLASRRQQPRR